MLMRTTLASGARLRLGQCRRAGPGTRCLAVDQDRYGRRQAGDRDDGKTVRGAKGKNGKAPHLIAALAHGIGVSSGCPRCGVPVPGAVGPADGGRDFMAVNGLGYRGTGGPFRC
jgi:hypothetical protein